MTTFLREKGALPAAGEVALYEHYIDRPAELDRVEINLEAEIVWSAVGQGESGVRGAFQRLLGPMPEFESLPFQRDAERMRAEVRNESRQSALEREVERCRRVSGTVHFGTAGPELRGQEKAPPER